MLPGDHDCFQEGSKCHVWFSQGIEKRSKINPSILTILAFPKGLYDEKDRNTPATCF